MDHRDRSDSKLPVTSEVGSEGGSFADPTHQVATFSGPANPNVSSPDRASRDPLAGTSVGAADDDTRSGMLRYPTEPPSPPDARESRRVGGHAWRTGLIGLAAGAAAVIGISRLRQRS